MSSTRVPASTSAPLLHHRLRRRQRLQPAVARLRGRDPPRTRRSSSRRSTTTRRQRTLVPDPINVTGETTTPTLTMGMWGSVGIQSGAIAVINAATFQYGGGADKHDQLHDPVAVGAVVHHQSRRSSRSPPTTATSTWAPRSTSPTTISTTTLTRRCRSSPTVFWPGIHSLRWSRATRSSAATSAG